MDARQSKRGKRISLQQEKQAAKDIGGTTMAASGATKMGGGGDVRVQGKIRLECKFTEKDTYSLKYAELKKIRKQAFKSLENPVLQFAFRHTSGRLKAYAVIPWEIGDKPKDTDNSWFSSSASVILTEHQLDNALMVGRIQFTFVHSGTEPLAFRLFEIMRWDDYVNKEYEDARDQHDSTVPGASDTVTGRGTEGDTGEG